MTVIPYDLALAFVLAFAAGVGLLFCFLIVQREVMTLLSAYARRRQTAFTPLIHRALGRGGTGLAADQLGRVLRRFDRPIVRNALLRLRLDLRGEDAEHIGRLYWRLGLLDGELARLRSWRSTRRAAGAGNLEILAIPGTLRALLPLLDDPDLHVRIAAVRAVGRIGSPEALAALVPALGDPRQSVSRQVQDILAESGGPITRVVRNYVRSTANRRGRLAAIELLGWHRAPEATRLLLELLQEEDPEVRVKAAKAAAAIGDPAFLETFHARTTDPFWEVRCHAARGLGLLGSPDSVAPLRPLLSDRHWWVRYHSAVALAELGPEGKSALETARSDPDARAREMARYVLERSVVPVLP